jgi:hypothetical protein
LPSKWTIFFGIDCVAESHGTGLLSIGTIAAAWLAARPARDARTLLFRHCCLSGLDDTGLTSAKAHRMPRGRPRIDLIRIRITDTFLGAASVRWQAV